MLSMTKASLSGSFSGGSLLRGVFSLAGEILSYATSVGRVRYTGRPCARTIPCQQTASLDKDTIAYKNQAVSQHAIDLDIGVLFSGEVGLGNGELFCGFLIRVKPVYGG